MKVHSVLIIGILLLGGCYSEVPGGHIGKIKSGSGFQEEALSPGHHTVWGVHTSLKLMEASDTEFLIADNVNVKDKFPIPFSFSVLVSPNLGATSEITDAFETLIPAGGNVITVEQLFNKYTRGPVIQTAKNVLSRRTAEEILLQRELVTEEFVQAVTATGNNATPLLRVVRVNIKDIDTPQVIEDAQKLMTQRTIEIETVKAEAQKRREAANADLHLATVQAQRKLIEAQNVADQNKLIDGSITPRFLAYQQTLALASAAENGQLILYPFTEVTNGAMDLTKWTSPQGVVDSELLRRLNAAKQSVKEPPSVITVD